MPRYNSDEYIDLQQDLRIDKDDLDVEAIIQPSRFHHAGEGHAYAVSRRDKAKHDLEVTTAVLDKDVRDQMSSDGEKITEALVKAQVVREQEYQRAYREYLAACLDADRWEALKNAYRHRADMVKGLIQLYQIGYFGEVTGAAERRDARNRFDDRRKA